MSAQGARIGVVTFPGSLDDRDAARAVRLAGAESVSLWHADHDLKSVDAVVLPGGFSYGDYLRCGAMASQSAVMKSVKAHADKGGMVLGICNGFQVLTETGLLPGALMRNAGLNFVCREVRLEVVNSQSIFTSRYAAGETVTIPVAHHDGNYTIDADGLKQLQDEDRIGQFDSGKRKTGDNCRRPKIATHGVYRKYHKPTHRPFGKRAEGISALARACHGFVRPLA